MTTMVKTIAAPIEQVVQTWPDSMARAVTALVTLAMRMERDQQLGARP